MKQSIRTHGRTFTGVVVAAGMHKTATIEWGRSKYIPKYERFEKLTTKVKAHVPENMTVKKGDLVKISECRPVSKTKHFIIVEKTGHEDLFEAREELRNESKFQGEADETD